MANDSLLFFNINSTRLLSSYDDGNGSSSTEQTTTSNSEHLQIVERLTIHITLIVSIVGLIGNACTITVLNRQSMRKWRSSMLLTALAAVDFLYLSIIFLSIIDALTKQAIGLHRSLALCQTTVYITHVCSFLSASFTLSFTLQRFVAVLFPLHANTIISTRSSIINILILIVFGCGFYSFSFFVTNVSNGQCREDESHPALFPLLIVDTCLTFVLPFIFILLFNFAIVYKLRQRKNFANIFGKCI
jgi:membrane-associated HD superfamily phosphohydrolase